MRKMIASGLVIVFLFSIAQVTFAKSQGDWSNLKNLIGQPVAVETTDGSTVFGVLNFVDDSEMKVQVADDERVSAREEFFKRVEVTKVWQAKFRFGQTNTRKGALIGLGIGLGVGYVTAFALAKRGPPHGLGLFPIAGVTVGAMVGSSKSKDHKKQKLIYSIEA